MPKLAHNTARIVDKFLEQTTTIKTLLAAIAAAGSLAFASATIYFTNETNHQVMLLREEYRDREYMAVKAQLNRIETGMSVMQDDIKDLKLRHKNDNPK